MQSLPNSQTVVRPALTTRSVEPHYMQSLPDSQTVVQATNSLDDQDLLGLYERTRESCYLEELVKRYHGLVVSVVRSSLCDTHDIQDAVQATFLILVKSALKIQQRRSSQSSNNISVQYSQMAGKRICGVLINWMTSDCWSVPAIQSKPRSKQCSPIWRSS